MRGTPVVSHWSSKAHTPINFPKLWAREKSVESFKAKCRYWTSFSKNLEKKIKNHIKFFLTPQSLNLCSWPQNAPCKNRARSNHLTRSLNRHQFLSINIESPASWKKISAASTCKVYSEVYIYTIERFSGKNRIIFVWHTLMLMVQFFLRIFIQKLVWILESLKSKMIYGANCFTVQFCLNRELHILVV